LRPFAIFTPRNECPKPLEGAYFNRRLVQVFGAVLGKVDEGHVEMVNSFELRMFTVDGDVRFNEEFLRQRLVQYKEVFPELDAVGWYCTGGEDLESNEITLQSLFADAMDSPLLVKLNPNVDSQAKRCDLYANELTEVDWTLVSEQSERIGIDHIAKLSQAGDDAAVSIEGKQMRAASSAVGMLLDRMEIICKYLKGVQEGRFPPNDEIIREANKVSSMHIMDFRFPADFDEGFKSQERDARAAMLLAKMTEICGTLSNLQACSGFFWTTAM
ncbi:unnamed protein product, partial [Nippostrongylus brasiliensis]|uniref:COP9 signalosome complex subunit 6 n=1 Tax=Nippostrongylus brasiliensis TaxID=27835 RepID=A0A0N4XC51_NIPBR